MMVCTVYIFLGLAFTSTIIEIVRRQMVENLRRMQELRAQIQAQVKLAETLKKISDNAGTPFIIRPIVCQVTVELVISSHAKYRYWGQHCG